MAGIGYCTPGNIHTRFNSMLLVQGLPVQNWFWQEIMTL